MMLFLFCTWWAGCKREAMVLRSLGSMLWLWGTLKLPRSKEGDSGDKQVPTAAPLGASGPLCTPGHHPGPWCRMVQQLRAIQMDLQLWCHFSYGELMPFFPSVGRYSTEGSVMGILRRISRRATVYEQPINSVHTVPHKKSYFPHFSCIAFAV